MWTYIMCYFDTGIKRSEPSCYDMIRYIIPSICFHIEQTISYSYTLLPYIGTLPFPSTWMYSTRFSLWSFSIDTLSIVVEPYSYKESWLLITISIKDLGFPAIREVFHIILLLYATIFINRNLLHILSYIYF